MNCDQFSSAINDLVRHQPVEAAEVREAALAHAGECETCGDALAQERALQIRLRSLAASMEGAEASPEVGAGLLEAFRAHSQGKREAARNARFGGLKLWPLAIGAALAAAAALVLAIALPSLNRAHKAETNPRLLAAPDRDGAIGAIPPPKVIPQAPGVRLSPGGEIAAARNMPQDRPKLGWDRGWEHSRNGSRTLGHGPVPDSLAGGPTEITTDFMPVSFGGNLVPLQDGQVLRTKVSRSLLLSYGLPVDPDRVDEPITADVIVGSDGMVRAIRFVHELQRRSR